MFSQGCQRSYRSGSSATFGPSATNDSFDKSVASAPIRNSTELVALVSTPAWSQLLSLLLSYLVAVLESPHTQFLLNLNGPAVRSVSIHRDLRDERLTKQSC